VIRDDGRGLDREKLIAKAAEKGLIQPGQVLTDAEAYALIFAPGFSTAAVVTDVSGRGVGMDVVRKNVEKLRGKIEIESELGQGTIFTIRLPLTLAIIDGMVVRVGRERFIIPTISIRQALKLQTEQVSTVQQRGRMCDFRGRLVPLVPLARLYQFAGTEKSDECMTVIAEYDNKQIGLVVDELIGQQQVVIKSLDTRFHAVRGVSGAAILGDGRVGLILDVGGVAAAFDDWHSSEQSQTKTPTAALVAAA
jgi:two-component system chemotaxis sensor kinase CheA